MANEFSGDAGFEWNRGNCKRMMPLISITVFVGVRFCEVSGAIEPRVFPSFKAAMEWCYCTHNLAVDKWEAFLTKRAPDGPIRLREGGKEKRVRNVGWQQRLDDGSMMQIFEQTVRDEGGH
jgi:hypothetical protein